MQKRIIGENQSSFTLSSPNHYLNLEELAEVEVSSEREDYPIEAALLPGFDHGWRAGASGKQIIRLLFPQAQAIKSIDLEFLETQTRRTQEYWLRVSSDAGQSFVDIVRQQWNFDPHGSTGESAHHLVDLTAVNIIELHINPDISDVNAFASLETMRVN